MEESGGLQSMGSLRVGHDRGTSLSLFTFMYWRRKCQPTPVFLPGESQGRGSFGGLLSMGSHRVGHDWSDLANISGQNSSKYINPITSHSSLLSSNLKPSDHLFSSVAQSCPTLCDPMNRSTPGLSVQTQIHRVGDAIQPSHPLSSPFPPAPNPCQHQSFPMSQLLAGLLKQTSN